MARDISYEYGRDTTQIYLNEIGDYALLSVQDEVKLARRIASQIQGSGYSTLWFIRIREQYP